ncbi:MAG: hypothetical protein ACM3IJ_02155 [Candidatus Levyibacteriota bacterium]
MRGKELPQNGFLARLHAVYDKPTPPPTHRVYEYDFSPTPGMKTADLPPELVFSELVSNVYALQYGAETEGRRYNRFLYTRALASQLTQKLAEDIDAQEFCSQQLTELEDRAPELAEDIAKIMMEAEDQRRFKKR